MHPLFWDPELSRMHLHPQIQISNAFPEYIGQGGLGGNKIYRVNKLSYLNLSLAIYWIFSFFLGEMGEDAFEEDEETFMSESYEFLE